ncbi:hypothetical protein GCM10010302_78590 [Streptomyces polychromogenes]|uniref:Uncharacterized protein n=1 Tax=Streptomyces polychromogenes TaxID=67342 RepID=A0ABP3FW09_9ACTN
MLEMLRGEVFVGAEVVARERGGRGGGAIEKLVHDHVVVLLSDFTETDPPGINLALHTVNHPELTAHRKRVTHLKGIPALLAIVHYELDREGTSRKGLHTEHAEEAE